MKLYYDDGCPYCRKIKQIVTALDTGGRVETYSLDDPEHRQDIVDVHGEYVDAPHLFDGDTVYYGVGPVAKRLATRLPAITLSGVSAA